MNTAEVRGRADRTRRPPRLVTLALTAGALVAFAGNSILCRMALGAPHIDPASFTGIRFASGALVLIGIVSLQGQGKVSVRSAWISGLVLVFYAVPFSFAYLSLTAGTGALMLFGSVQVTMLVAAWASGERPSAAQWGGLVMAIAGLAGLLLPGITAPPAHGAVLMILAGVCWGVYTLRGRGAGNPLQHTAANFIVTAPLALIVMAVSWPALHLDRYGMLLAASSGALTSGLGYVLWYEALKGLTATRAAVVQLAVPVLAAVGGVVFIGERISLRLVLGGAVVLGGIAITLVARDRRTTSIEMETG